MSERRTESDADLLRRAADVMQDFGFVHAAIADGLRVEADRLDSGEQSAAETESLNLAWAYVGDETRTTP